MTNKINELTEIIKQEGIGKYLGKYIDKGEEKDKYGADVKMGLTDKGKYSVIVIPNLPSHFPIKLRVIFYNGHDEIEAERIFNKIVEKDKKDKQNLVHELFNKN